ncbi:BAH domain-containing protein [Psidium guajava]|nr:BAH domain-containing protein [Psidium guajava]
MSDDKDGFVAWEERIICAERGNRVVHFYLKDASGNSVLAVVGTERSIRHMMYIATDDFVQLYGSNGLIKGCKKWRARREVVELLASLVSNSETDDTVEALVSYDTVPPRKLKAIDQEIEWAGVAWVCAKQLTHYPAFHRKDITIAIHSFALILAEEGCLYLGYVEDMCEDKKGLKKVKVRWFYQNEEVQHVIPQLNLHPREVLITPYVQMISAECVEGPATVLTAQHYEKCVASVSQASAAGIYMCSRQFKNNKVKPFSLAKLRGYPSQAILSCLDSSFVCKTKSMVPNKNGEDKEECKAIDGSGGSGTKIPEPQSQTPSAYPKLKLKLSRKNTGIKITTVKPQVPFSFRVNDKIELLCQDSGIRGCWFRCQIMQMSEKRLKVKYDDLLDADDSAKLEEWVPAVKVASPDKLGMRCPGRQTIRPRPPKNSVDCKFEVGMAVDAWWCDGWWEGVVTRLKVSGKNSLEVYFPGEGRLATFQKKKVRVSRDWVDQRWVDIKSKPDINAFLSANSSAGIKSSSCTPVEEAPKCNKSPPASQKIASTSKKGKVIIEEKELPDLSASHDLRESVRVDKQTCFSQPDVQKSIGVTNHNGGSGTSAVAVGNEKGTASVENPQSDNRLFEIADAVELMSQAAEEGMSILD